MNNLDRKRILALAVDLYKDVEPTSEQKILEDFLTQTTEYNLKTFICSFVCYGTFGHSHPELLEGPDVDLFIERADPFLQAAILQRSMMQ